MLIWQRLWFVENSGDKKPSTVVLGQRWLIELTGWPHSNVKHLGAVTVHLLVLEQFVFF